MVVLQIWVPKEYMFLENTSSPLPRSSLKCPSSCRKMYALEPVYILQVLCATVHFVLFFMHQWVTEWWLLDRLALALVVLVFLLFEWGV